MIAYHLKMIHNVYSSFFIRLLDVGRKLERSDEEALNLCADYLVKLGEVCLLWLVL